MKAVILAGGLGSRLSEETQLKPKPMIEIGGKPILWHIMKIYSAFGIHDFIVCCGYKGYVIKEYFANYSLHNSDVTFDLEHNQVQMRHCLAEPWRVTLVDTGDETMTGGRVKRVSEYIKNEDAFCLTYGDGVSDVNIGKLIAFHMEQNVKATLLAVVPPGRFGAVELDGQKVRIFEEKRQGGIINGGFFVLSPEVLNYIPGDDTRWEGEPLEQLAKEGQLAAFMHRGFWHPMDTLHDKNYLNEIWTAGNAPWKMWW